MRKFFLSGAALIAFAAPAVAQVGAVPQTGVIAGLRTQYTYNAVAIGLVPAATATDVFCIAGSGSKTIKVQELRISGTATAAISLSAVMLTRNIADTGGTPATGVANPANATGELDRDPSPPPTATLISYTANPTINDASPMYVKGGHVPIGVTASGSAALVWSFGSQLSQFSQQLTLRGANQQACLNLQGTSIGAAGTTNVSIQWTEE